MSVNSQNILKMTVGVKNNNIGNNNFKSLRKVIFELLQLQNN